MSIKQYIQALVAVALSAAVATSCEKKIERIPVLTMGNAVIGNGGGTRTLEVASDTDWQLSVDKDWIHFWCFFVYPQ